MNITEEKNRIMDPEIIFKNFSNIITSLILEIEEKYNAGYEEIVAFIKNNEPDLFEEIENNYNAIDSDIYKKHREKNLSAKELDRWEKNLKKWYSSIKKGLQKFKEFKKTTIN